MENHYIAGSGGTVVLFSPTHLKNNTNLYYFCYKSEAVWRILQQLEGLNIL